ncbi:MAG TPA: YdeI/OmpD-associated family protein [Candidatus Limnocylindria bacterium]|nr:YdeI/OmpD-associated family protein [Candidatus Limnocylindria bacterium]
MRFRTKILAAGKTAAGIEVPAKVVQGLSSSKVPLVKVTINGYTYRSAVAVMGGKFMIGVSNDNRKAAGVAAGETVDVDLELDTEPRELAVPDDFAKALGKDAKAKKAFEGLSNSRKQRLVLPVANGKTPETRQRNIDKAMKELRG